VEAPRAAEEALMLVWALCADARSGSTWLSQLAASTGMLGYPDEYLLNWPRWRSRLGWSSQLTLEEYLSCLLRERTSPNGMFGIKGSLSQLRAFFDFFPATPCVWLRRENKLKQALSWHRANDGGLWRHTDVSRERPFAISVHRILGFYDEIVRREARWYEYFAQRNIQPLLLTYETVCLDPLAAVRAIAAHVGVEPQSIRRVTSPLKIVRDEDADCWVERAAEALAARPSKQPA
jgi:LPS sulfotransferase NodH